MPGAESKTANSRARFLMGTPSVRSASMTSSKRASAVLRPTWYERMVTKRSFAASLSIYWDCHLLPKKFPVLHKTIRLMPMNALSIASSLPITMESAKRVSG